MSGSVGLVSGLKHSHVVVHRHKKRLIDKHRDKLEAHRLKGGPFAAAVEQLLRDHEEVESCLNNRPAATPLTELSAAR